MSLRQRFYAVSLAFLALIYIGQANAWWQSVPQQSVAGAPAGYTGPGDVVSGAIVWYGLRGYNTADISPAANVCLPSDLVCADLTLSSGNVVVPGSLSTCNITTVICTVKTLYDKIATGCTGSCDLTNATEATRPTFRPAMAANGCSVVTKPCILFNGVDQQLTSTGTFSVSQPTTISWVANSSNISANQGLFVAAGGGQFNYAGYTNSANQGTLYAGNSVIATVSSGAWHALQGVFNGASSDLNVDGTANVVNAGADSLTGGVAIYFGHLNGTQFCACSVVEAGYWPSGFSGGQSISMSANQHSYWGF